LFDNDIANKANYGALNNWYKLGAESFCPAGWHLPNPDDFLTLINNAGGEYGAG